MCFIKEIFPPPSTVSKPPYLQKNLLPPQLHLDANGIHGFIILCLLSCICAELNSIAAQKCSAGGKPSRGAAPLSACETSWVFSSVFLTEMHCVPQLQPEKGNPEVQCEWPQPARGSSMGTAQVTLLEWQMSKKPSQVGPCPALLGPARAGGLAQPSRGLSLIHWAGC